MRVSIHIYVIYTHTFYILSRDMTRPTSRPLFTLRLLRAKALPLPSFLPSAFLFPLSPMLPFSHLSVSLSLPAR